VYIGEAHPSDAWQVASNLRDRVIVDSPLNAAEREALASICVTRLAIELPALVDGFDDAVEKAYTGWPERLYLIDRDGRVAYKSRPGPYGFRLIELERALHALVGVPT
jgi:type I thyroxine 5'-deiodinase